MLRLRFEAGLSERQIAASLSAARSTVQEWLRRVRKAELSWPQAGDLDDVALAARLYPSEPVAPGFPLTDFPRIRAEQANSGVTRRLLLREYRTAHPDGCMHSAFCNHYRVWCSTQDAVLRPRSCGL